MKELLELYCAFFRVGAVTFGGGYAMLPIIQREVVERKKWATEEEMADYYAISQCTPGAIAVNVATFIGRKYAGIAGGVIATLGVVSPSAVIICVIAALIHNFAEISWVKDAMGGIRVCVCVFIFNAVVRLIKSAVTDKVTLGLYLVLFAAAVFLTFLPFIPCCSRAFWVLRSQSWGCGANDSMQTLLGILQNRPVCHWRRHGNGSLPAGNCG